MLGVFPQGAKADRKQGLYVGAKAPTPVGFSSAPNGVAGLAPGRASPAPTEQRLRCDVKSCTAENQSCHTDSEGRGTQPPPTREPFEAQKLSPAKESASGTR
jgi:hypothetical protein